MENKNSFAAQHEIFYMSFSAGGRSVPESLLPTKTLSVHSDMEMGRHLHVPAVMVIDVL